MTATVDHTTTPLARPTAGDRVADVIRRRIWEGQLRSGDRINQEDLATELGVSRIPVREALLGLEREGVVRMPPHRGSFVEAIDERSVFDHFELYGLVDGFALRKACERASPAELADLVRALRRPATRHSAGPLQAAMIDARATMHELGGSPRFRAVARGLSGIVPGNFFESVPGSIDVARLGMPLVAEAVTAGDRDGAVEHYRSMMNDQGRLLVADLDRRELLGPDRAELSEERP